VSPLPATLQKGSIMEVTVKKQEVLDLQEALVSLKDFDWNKNPKSVYNIVKNIKLIKDEVETINEALKPPKELQAKMDEYNEKLRVIWKDCAEKDADGNPVVRENAGRNQNPYVIKEKVTRLTAEVEKLDKEYMMHKAIEEHNKNVMDMMKEDVKINVHQMELDDSFKGVNTGQMMALSPIIKE